MEFTIHHKGERFTVQSTSTIKGWRIMGPWEERSYGAYSRYDSYIWTGGVERFLDHGIFGFLPDRKLIARAINMAYKKFQKEKAAEAASIDVESIERSLRKYN